jgi:hypothetical protein
VREAKANEGRFLRWLSFRRGKINPPGSAGSSLNVPLSIQPNADYLVETPDGAYEKLVNLIELSDGGVFAVTGVRGAGKSILLNAVIRHFQSKFHTLGLSAPVSASHELEFFLALFRILCGSVRSRLKSVLTRMKTDLKTIGTQQARRQLALIVPLFLLVQVCAAVSWKIHLNRVATYRLLALLTESRSFGSDALGEFQNHLDYLSLQKERFQLRKSSPQKSQRAGQNQLEDQPYENRLEDLQYEKWMRDDPQFEKHLEEDQKILEDRVGKLKLAVSKASIAAQSVSQNSIATRLWSVPDSIGNDALTTVDELAALSNSDRFVLHYGIGEANRDRFVLHYGIGDSTRHTIGWSYWPDYLAYGLLSMAVLFICSILARQIFLFRHYLQHVGELGLLSESEELAEYLDYELTQSREAEVSVPLFSRLGGRYKRGHEYKSRAISLPGLTAQYINYVEKILQVFPDKLIICIDELDKVTDLDNVRFILREIKGGLYVKGCFYIVSISEDARRSFETRLSGARDIFESTFDEVITISQFSIDACKKLIYRRLQSAGITANDEVDRAIVLSAVLSSGIPRDLIRNFRESIMATNGIDKLQFCTYWQHLFHRRIREITEGLMVVQVFDPLRAELLQELEMFSNTNAHDEGQSYEHSLSLVASRLDNLQAELAKTTASIEPVTELNGAILKAWVRSWMELKIYLLARYCCNPEHENGQRDLTAEKLRKAYSILPYSAETCARLLSEVQARAPGD